MNAKTQFNVVSNSIFNGRNLEACLESSKENGYKSNKWITYFQASELGLTSEAGLRGKAVSLIRFKKEGKKSTPAWYNVFNLDVFDNVPEELTKKRTPSAKKASKKAAKAAPKATKKAAKAAPKKAAKAAPTQETKPAIPIAGEPGFYLVANEAGVYQKVQLGS